jgi:glucosamine 6-phosphate synthetase-like amidotransferase/phosphosugar isomerase protein
VYDEALSWCREVEVPRYSSTFLVGTGLTYPLAVYGKAKIFEVLGAKAQSQRTEQFSHMELFSLTKDDVTIIIPEGQGDLQARMLQAMLEEGSFKTVMLQPRFRDVIEESLRVAIYLQVLAWKTAKDRGMKDCAFINKSDLLRISDRMIYLPERL